MVLNIQQQVCLNENVNIISNINCSKNNSSFIDVVVCLLQVCYNDTCM